MPANPRLSVIIPVYRGVDDAIECIESVLHSSDREMVEITVVDDASGDNTADRLADRFPEINLIRHETNRGYVHAVNTGYGHCSSASDCIALLNSDAIVQDGWAEAAVAELDRDAEVGAVACRVLLHNDPARLDSAGLAYTMAGWNYRRGHGELAGPPYDAPGDVFGATGCAAVLRRSAIPDKHIFRPELICFYEDVDLAIRLQLAGWRCRYLPSSTARHKVSRSYSPDSDLKMYCVSRNSEEVFWRYMPRRLMWRAVPARAGMVIMQAAKAAYHGKFRRFWSGKVDAVRAIRARERPIAHANDADRLVPWIDRAWFRRAVGEFSINSRPPSVRSIVRRSLHAAWPRTRIASVSGTSTQPAEGSTMMRQLQKVATQRGWYVLSECPLCGSTAFRLIRVHQDYLGLCKCESCEIVFLNPRSPNTDYKPGHLTQKYVPTMIERGYLSEAYRPHGRKIYQSYRKIADMTQMLAPRSPVVDIGCGVGLSMLAMQHLGIASRGIEINNEFVEFATRHLGLDVRLHDVMCEPIEPRVDVATLSSVLEHIPEPIEFLQAIRQNILLPRGALVVTVPNLLSLEYIRDGEAWRNINGGHIWYFTEMTLARIAEDASFAVEHVYREDQPFDGSMQNARIYVRDFLGLDINFSGGIGMILRAR